MFLFQQNDLQLDADKDEDQGPDQDTNIDLDKDQHFTEEKILILRIINIDSNVQIVCLGKSSIYLLYHHLYQT